MRRNPAVDPVVPISEHLAALRYDALPAEAVAAARQDLLDTLAALLAGLDAEGVGEIVELARTWGGRAEATLLGFGDRVPAPLAAFVNSTTAHARDFDDTHDHAVLHAGISVIPAALAAAEVRGGVSGAELLTAITAGLDLICRLGLATKLGPQKGGFALTALYGYFAAAATAARVLGLDAEGIARAIGIVYSQAGGSVQAVRDGGLTKRMQPAFGARDGVFSAILAAKGITGAREVFAGPYGLFNVYQRGEADLDVLTRDLGRVYHGVDLSYKPYPCCRYAHTSIDSALALRRAHGFSVQDVEAVEVAVTSHASIVCEPREQRQKPRQVVDAQFSIPWTVATALVKGEVGLDDFTPAALRNETVLAVASRVATRYDEEMERRFGREISPAEVRVRLRDGRELVQRVDYPTGSPRNPMSEALLVKKLEGCAARAGWAPSRVRALAEVVAALERQTAADLIAALA